MILNCEIQLPASKSESNRALMIAAYGDFAPSFLNLSDSTDTKVLSEALMLCPSQQRINVADCGTAARFLTTYLASREGEWLLTGTERMKQRPIAPLVETLRSLGADIQYVEEDGCLPLRIKGKSIAGGKTSIDMTQSSQFASSLLLAAPMWPEGLELELKGNLNSLPYLDMTLSIMRHFSAQVERNGNRVVVRPRPYHSADFVVSSDWTAASYWYEMAALSDAGEIKLLGFAANHRYDSLGDVSTKVQKPSEKPAQISSLQGDALVADWMQQLGVETQPDDDAIILKKVPFGKKIQCFDFSHHPDLFPTIVATCAGLQVEARFTGISTLKLKESDRVKAMQEELAKIGAKLVHIADNELVLKPSLGLPCFSKNAPLLLDSHNDHRVVMALAPLALKMGAVGFDHPEVVEKSYPRFWYDAHFLDI